ncbi:hypothetical protein JXA80_05325 [bacterium]|nr:hypothetical protein [candidate division CSSED10-310 bacterium]
MNRSSCHPAPYVSAIILITTLFGCATRDDFKRTFIERYVQEGVYTNEIKGFRLNWPDSASWLFRNYPEFDLSFDHVDGRSQILVTGVNNLIRRDFPDGFHDWMFDRLQAHSVTRLTIDDLTADGVEKFRIVSDCRFSMRFGESFGVQRRTDVLLLRKDRHWVAVVCICPPDHYEEKRDAFEAVFDSVDIL